MIRSCKVCSKDAVMIKNIKFLEMYYVFLSIMFHSCIFYACKKNNLLHFIALQILYLFHMDFLLKIGNKFEIF